MMLGLKKLIYIYLSLEFNSTPFVGFNCNLISGVDLLYQITIFMDAERTKSMRRMILYSAITGHFIQQKRRQSLNAETDVYLNRWLTNGNIDRQHHLTVLYRNIQYYFNTITAWYLKSYFMFVSSVNKSNFKSNIHYITIWINGKINKTGHKTRKQCHEQIQ